MLILKNICRGRPRGSHNFTQSSDFSKEKYRRAASSASSIEIEAAHYSSFFLHIHGGPSSPKYGLYKSIPAPVPFLTAIKITKGMNVLSPINGRVLKKKKLQRQHWSPYTLDAYHCKHFGAWLTILYIICTCPSLRKLRRQGFVQLFRQRIPLHLAFLVGEEYLISFITQFNFFKQSELLHLL